MFDCQTTLSASYLLSGARIAFNTDIPLVVNGCEGKEQQVLSVIKSAFGDADYTIDGGCITVTPKPLLSKTVFNTADLLSIMDILISENGCPWDRVQTHESIKKNLLEEAEEAADAITRGDLDNLKEELGDVLLQSVFHSRIAEKNGTFNYSDVLTRLCNKLISRHTHVFGENKADNPEEALNAWKAAKLAEKGKKP